MIMCVALFMVYCGWCGVAMAQTGDGSSAPQLRVRIFLEAPLGTAAAAPLAVRVQHVGSVLQLMSGGDEATTQVKVVIDAMDTTVDLRMMVSVDDAEVVAVPNEPIIIAADGIATRRTAQFALTAKRAGVATVFIAVTDSINNVTVALRVVVTELMPQHTLAVIEPQADTELRLLNRGIGATTQVQVVVDATDTAAELRMTISVNDAEVVTIPNEPIIIAADGNATQRSTEFALTAKTTGTATVTIVVTDGANNVAVALRVVVAEPMPQHTLAVIKPQADTELRLLSRGIEATTQVQVVVDATDTAAELRMTFSVDATGAEVVAIPSEPIVITADGDATRRSAEFALTAKTTGTATVTIAVTDGANNVTVVLRVVVVEPMLQPSLVVIEPQSNTVLRLIRDDVETMTQVVQVVINAIDGASTLTMTLSVDAAGAEVVVIPSKPIAIAADGNAMRRTAQFTLTAKTTGTATVTIAVTDGTSTDTVALRVVVVEPPSLYILSPSDGARIGLVRGDGSLATTQVEVLIVQTNVEASVVLSVQLERDALPSVFIPSDPLILTASDDGNARTRFTLAAAEAGNTTLTLAASDSLGNYAVASVRVSVTRLSESCEICLVPDMLTVSSGTFTMGSPADEPGRFDSEEPQHQVNIGYAFAVGQYELTRGQYGAFVDAAGYDAGSGWLDPSFAQNDAHPVVNVSWEDVKAYLSWLSEVTGEEWRLLSEAEWEYAARAGTTTSYVFGNTIDPAQANYKPRSSGTMEVGSYAANPFGLYDMNGNVWEWVEDCWHSNYIGAPTDGSAWVSGCDTNRILRGGSWDSVSRSLRSASRVGETTVFRDFSFGFRIARTLPETAVVAPLAVRVAASDSVLQLLTRGAGATAQVQVVVDATDTAAELRMTLSVDATGTKVVAIPSEPIVIVTADSATRRIAQFELTAKTTGTATVTIAVTDGASTETVALRIVVVEPTLEILSPSDGTQIALVRGDGSLAATQVEVVIVQQHTKVPVELDLQLDHIATPPVFISTTSLILTPSADGRARTRFTLAAAEAGNTTLTLVASNSLGNRAVVSMRVSVVSLSELCESCLVPDMRTVSTGTFTMGSPIYESDRAADEGPQHLVRFGYTFAVGQYELTRGQYRAFVDASGHAAGSDWLDPGFTQNDAHPVVEVSWEDAKAYLSWLSEETSEEWRLLSEAEWEYVARAGTTTSYAFGNTIDTTQARFVSSTGTVAVGSYAANAFGLHDMHGNVWEWVEDCWHTDYNDAPVDGSAWLSECDLEEIFRVRRGGSWKNLPGNLRSADRVGNRPGSRIDNLGFRVARTLSP